MHLIIITIKRSTFLLFAASELHVPSEQLLAHQPDQPTLFIRPPHLIEADGPPPWDWPCWSFLLLKEVFPLHCCLMQLKWDLFSV